jgi:hypothetical protein
MAYSIIDIVKASQCVDQRTSVCEGCDEAFVTFHTDQFKDLEIYENIFLMS